MRRLALSKEAARTIAIRLFDRGQLKGLDNPHECGVIKAARLAIQGLQVKIDLPIESERNSVFQVKFDNHVEYVVGSLWKHSTGFLVRIEGVKGSHECNKENFFKILLDKGDSQKIEKFEWVSNPANFNDWTPEPEIPACPITTAMFRFHYYRNDVWQEGFYQICDNHSVISVQNGAFNDYDEAPPWDYLPGLKAFEWQDFCPKHGEWPGI